MGGNGIRIEALGVTVDVEVDDSLSSSDISRLRDAWGAAASLNRSADITLHAGLGGSSQRALDVMGHDYRSLAANISTVVTLAAIERRRSELLMLHACGVASPDGSVVAFVGPSGRGKTTLARHLATKWSYVTDETVGIGLDGTVLPYRKPLSIIEDGRMSGTKAQVGADALGLRALPAAHLRIAAVVMLDRSPAHGDVPESVPVGLVDAIIQLVPEMSYLSLLDRPLQRLAHLLETTGGARRVAYRDAATVIPLLEALADSGPQENRPDDWSALADVASDTLESASVEGTASVYRRQPVTDGIAVEGRYVILRQNRVRVLDGIGPAIWDALEAPATLGAIVEAVIARFGVPDEADPTFLVRAGLEELSRNGLVVAGETEVRA